MSEEHDLTRRDILRWSALAGGVAVLAGTTLPRGVAAQTQTPLPAAITAVMRKPRYAKATWSLLAVDVQTGQTLYALEPDVQAFTGSVRKLFSVGLALQALGAEHRIATPVHRRGEIGAGGTLQGDLILVAAGDLTFGGRLNGDGSIAFTNFDHNDANNLGTAILTPQNPLLGLDSLAQEVAASGIRTVSGDVIIDDRLFQSFRVPNGNLLIPPIMVNENMVDVSVTPTQAGRAAEVEWRPHSAAFAVDGVVATGAAGTEDSVTLSGNARIECIGTGGCSGALDGSIPVVYRAPLSGSQQLVQTFRIENPAAYARTAFIEALGRQGVAVAAETVGANPAGRLPPSGAYSAATRVAQFISPFYDQYARLILKVSLNLGANLSLMQYGLTRGQRTIRGALAAEREALVNRFGIAPDAFDFPTNGSGSPDSRATPRAVVQMLTAMSRSSVAAPYAAALPVLGVDGSLAGTGTNLPARGHVYAKTGTTVIDGELKAQNLGGYIDAKSGRRLAFALFVNDAGPLEQLDDIGEVFEDEAAISNAIYELA